MKQIHGPGFVMLDETPIINRADFWFLQANRLGRVLLTSRNRVVKGRVVRMWKDKIAA